MEEGSFRDCLFQGSSVPLKTQVLSFSQLGYSQYIDFGLETSPLIVARWLYQLQTLHPHTT